MLSLDDAIEIVKKISAEGGFEQFERVAYPERFDANGKRIASNADKEPDETGGVLKEEEK
jgi:hypothetical protein